MDPIVPPPPPEPHFSWQTLVAQIKLHKTPLILASIGLLIIGGMGSYLLSPARQTLVQNALQIPTLAPSPTLTPTQGPPTPTLVPSQTPTPTPNVISWKRYTNSTYGYSIDYPPDWYFQDLGALEPLVPSYVVFNQRGASTSARFISVSISTRTYQQQLTFGASSSATTIAGITGTRQFFQDSNGNTSTAVILPRPNNLLILRSKTTYLPIFNQMLTTVTSTN